MKQNQRINQLAALVCLEEDTSKKLFELKKELGIKSNADVVRYAITRAWRTLCGEKKK